MNTKDGLMSMLDPLEVKLVTLFMDIVSKKITIFEMFFLWMILSFLNDFLSVYSIQLGIWLLLKLGFTPNEICGFIHPAIP